MAERESRRDVALLLDMLLSAQDAKDFNAGLDKEQFMTSRLHKSATIRALEVIGEAAGRVSKLTQAAHPDIAWQEIIGMRHRLIHGYADVNLDLVWLVTQEHIPALISVLEKLLKTRANVHPPS